MPGKSAQLRRRGSHRGDGITLSDIIRGLQYCVNSSQDIVEQHHIASIARFLDDDNRPVTRTINFGNAAIDVPLLCLSGHSSLVLDELNVKLNLMLRNTALKAMTGGPNAVELIQDRVVSNSIDQSKKEGGRKHNSEERTLPPAATRTCFGVDLANVNGPDRRYANLEIGMKFKSSNPPEMFSRIIDKLNNATDAYLAESPKTEMEQS